MVHIRCFSLVCFGFKYLLYNGLRWRLLRAGTLVVNKQDMKKRTIKISMSLPGLVMLLLLVSMISGYGQRRENNAVSNFNRLQLQVERTEQMLQLLPVPEDNAAFGMVADELRNAKLKVAEGQPLAQNGNLARLAIVNLEIAASLRRIESLLQSHPVFRLKFQEELERKLQEAESAVQGSQNREALYMLSRAKYFREQALLLARQSRTYSALEHYRLAVHFADNAVRIASRGFDRMNDQDWRRFFDDTKLILDKARQISNDAGGNNMGNVIRRAERELETVANLYERGEQNTARQKLVIVNKALYRVLDLAADLPQNEKEQIRARIESSSITIDGFEKQLDGRRRPAARRLLSRANQLLSEARHHLDQNQLARARRKATLANRVTANLSRLFDSAGTVSSEDVLNGIADAEKTLESILSEDSEWPGRENLAGLIKQNLENARQRTGDGDIVQASRHLKIANQLTAKLNRLQLRELQEAVGKEIVTAELERLDQLMERMLQQDQSGNPEFELRYQNARELHQQARAACEQGNYRICRELMRLASNLISK